MKPAAQFVTLDRNAVPVVKYRSKEHKRIVNAKVDNRHKISCHRCGNIRQNKNTLCVNCPYLFCHQCTEKLKQEHGRDVFDEGCPLCKELCCCGANRSNNCQRKYHCYRKCPVTKESKSNEKNHFCNDIDQQRQIQYCSQHSQLSNCPGCQTPETKTNARPVNESFNPTVKMIWGRDSFVDEEYIARTRTPQYDVRFCSGFQTLPKVTEKLKEDCLLSEEDAMHINNSCLNGILPRQYMNTDIEIGRDNLNDYRQFSVVKLPSIGRCIDQNFQPSKDQNLHSSDAPFQQTGGSGFTTTTPGSSGSPLFESIFCDPSGVDLNSPSLRRWIHLYDGADTPLSIISNEFDVDMMCHGEPKQKGQDMEEIRSDDNEFISHEDYIIMKKEEYEDNFVSDSKTRFTVVEL